MAHQTNRLTLGRRALGAFLAAALGAACGNAAPQEPAGVESLAQPSIRAGNGIQLQTFVNPISGNADALRALVGKKLIDSTFSGPSADPTLSAALNADPDAQIFMKYVVGCALPDGAAVNWTSTAGTHQTWDGALGLCPEWSTGTPTEACLVRVSSCLLARDNALGHHIIISTRHPQIDSTELVATLTPDSGLPSRMVINSFNPCSGGAWGADYDCGWRPEWTGTCTPDAGMWIGAGAHLDGVCTAAQVGSLEGDRVMRVCPSAAGCDNAAALGSTDNSGCDITPALAFRCPATGIFSVMSAPYVRGAGDGGFSAYADGAKSYPAREREVFHVREGAFYGNIFDPLALNPKLHVEVKLGKPVNKVVPNGALYMNAWACADPGWVDGLAYLNERLCALTDTGTACLATPLGTCWKATKTPDLCSTDDIAPTLGDGDFGGCMDGDGGIWSQPVTVFLRDACDLAPNHCKRTDGQ